MMSIARTRRSRALGLLASMGALGAPFSLPGCGAEAGPSMPEGVPTAAQGPLSDPATLCGEYEATDDDGVLRTYPEFYVFSAMDRKLAGTPELRDHVGFDRVDSCDAARVFATRYQQFLRTRPLMEDVPEPTGDYPTEARPEESDTGQVQQAIQLGTTANHPAVLRLDFLSSGAMCSGTSISTYGILTAAHCVPANGWQQVYVYRQSAGSLRSLMGGPAWIWFTRHPNFTGIGDYADDMAVGTLWSDYPANTLPAPSSSAIRLWLGGGTVGQQLRIYGFGANDIWGSGGGVERLGQIQLSQVGGTYYGGLPASGDATPNVPCKGDSGGPLVGAYGSYDLQYGVWYGYEAYAPWQYCPAGANVSYWSRVSAKMSWIESLLGMTCSRYSGNGGTYARCW